MKAMILAAGRGERLRPMTDITPKPLLEVRGKPLIVHHLEALAQAGFDEIVVNLSWLGQRVRDYLGDGSAYKLRIEYSEEPEALETAGGILQALPLLGDNFIVVNADIFTDYDFALLKQIDSVAHLVLVDNPQHNTDGDFSLEQSMVGNNAVPRYTFSGIGRYQRSFFDGLASGKQALAPLLRNAADNKLLTGELYRGEWFDIGTPERLQALNDYPETD
jgi:MurNAc alpha-1-phosphate uridylyltransferase